MSDSTCAVAYRWSDYWIERRPVPEPSERAPVPKPERRPAPEERLEAAVARLEAATGAGGFELPVAAERLWSAVIDCFAASPESLPFAGGEFGPRRSELLGLLSRLSRAATREPERAAVLAEEASAALRTYLAGRGGVKASAGALAPPAAGTA